MLLILGFDCAAQGTPSDWAEPQKIRLTPCRNGTGSFYWLVLDVARTGNARGRSIRLDEQGVDAADYHGNDGDCEDNYHCVQKEDCGEHFSLS